MKLFNYYRSSASYRVRIALNYKNIDYTALPVNLKTADQKTPAFKEHNPQGRIPVLVDDDFEFGQSLAILEYLEEKFPEPHLLPANKQDRAWVRYLANIVTCDIHPLNNPSVLTYLKKNLHQDEVQVKIWYHYWLKQGFDALATILKNSKKSGNCCFGDNITFADVCLIPQIYNAFRYEFPMDDYPQLLTINDYCLSLPYVSKAKPD